MLCVECFVKLFLFKRNIKKEKLNFYMKIRINYDSIGALFAREALIYIYV